VIKHALSIFVKLKLRRRLHSK